MIYIQPNNPHPLQVRAVFSDGIDAFQLAKGDTLAKLAQCLCDLETRHDGSAMSIQIQFDTAPSGAAH